MRTQYLFCMFPSFLKDGKGCGLIEKSAELLPSSGRKTDPMSETPKAGKQNFLLRQAREEQNLRQFQVAEEVGVDERTYRRWENEGSLPQPYAQQKLLRFFGKTTPEQLGFGERTRLPVSPSPHLSVDRPGVPGSLPAIWNVPYPQNPLFTGREEVLTQLAITLHAGQATALSQPQALSGLGGIGKTQLALEYAYRHRQDYQVVLWAQAETRENLTSSYLSIAALLHLPQKDAPESARVIAAVKGWLQAQKDCLLILDNADDLALAREFLPPCVSGHVLLTTRAQATGRFARRLQVEILPTELGALFLLHRAGRLALDAALEQAPAPERDRARLLCEELGGLPLALDQ